MTTDTLIQVNPNELLLDLNVRGVTTADPDLIESVRDVGVLQPITVVRTSTGQYRVRYGNRRTLAACTAGLATVPVIIAGDEDGNDVERIVRQLDENERRAELTQRDRVAAVQQLAAFGVSAAQIAKRTRTPRARVDAALRVARSEFATQAADEHPYLDLEQAAVIAEYEDDPDTVTDLMIAAKVGNFEHAAQRAADQRPARVRYLAAVGPYLAAGVRIIQAWHQVGHKAGRLADLLDTDNERITEAAHADCPGHTILVQEEDGWFLPGEVPDGWTVDQAVTAEQWAEQDEDRAREGDDTEAPPEGEREVYAECVVTQALCADWAANGHRFRRATRDTTEQQQLPDGTADDLATAEAEKAAKTEERRRVIRNNKAWASAETVRRKWLTGLLSRKTPPKGTALFVAEHLTQRSGIVNWFTDKGGPELALTLLGLRGNGPMPDPTRAITSALDGASDARAQVISLGLILTALEAHTRLHTWRFPAYGNPAAVAYFAFLTANGYPMTEIEKVAIGQDPLPVPAE